MKGNTRILNGWEYGNISCVLAVFRADPRSKPGADPSRPDRVRELYLGWSQQVLHNEYTMPTADPSRHHRTNAPCPGLIPAGIQEQWAILRADPSEHYRTRAPCPGLIPSGIKEQWAMPGADPCRHQRTGELKNCYSKKNTTCYSKSIEDTKIKKQTTYVVK